MPKPKRKSKTTEELSKHIGSRLEFVRTTMGGNLTQEEFCKETGIPKKQHLSLYESGRVRGSKWHILGLGSGTAYGYSLIITFDEKGIVKGRRISRGEVEGGTQVHD